MSKTTLDYTNNISQSPFEHSKPLKNTLEGGGGVFMESITITKPNTKLEILCNYSDL